MIRRIMLFLTLSLLFAAGCTAAEKTDNDPIGTSTADQAEIYAAAIREIQGIVRSSNLVYVIATTEDMAFAGAPEAPSQKLSIELQEAITAELADEPFELIWIERFDDAPIGPINPEITEGWIIAGGDGIVITLGNIHPQKDETVQLSFFMSCADICGSGKTYVLEEVFNMWHVTGIVGPEIAS